MKTQILTLFAFAFFTASLASAQSYAFKEPFSRSAVFDAKGKISLQNVNGSVVVETWDRNEIRIEGEKGAKTEEELKLIELTIELSESLADIVVRLPKRSGAIFGGTSVRGGVSFKLTIPATASLEKVKTVNGSVTVSGVRGTTHAGSVNGQVRAEDLQGDVYLETVNGQVDASFATVAAGRDLTLKTVNGRIKITLPADAGMELRSSVVNGRVQSDFPVRGQDSTRKGKRLSGTIGDGRATLNAKTVNGSIQIAKR